MSEGKPGLRALPPALLLAFAAWFVMLVANVVLRITVKEPWTALRFQLTADGVGFATEVLATFGAFELARRLTGRAALGVRIAGAALLFEIVLDLAWALVQFKSNLWEHEWIYKAADYAFWAGWMVIPIGLFIALGRENRVLGIMIVSAALLTWPPAFLAKGMYSWLPTGNAGFVIDGAMRGLRYALMLAGFAALAAQEPTSDRVIAASGLRTAAKSLWLRVIAAIVVVLLTLMVIGGRGSKGSMDVLKLAMFTALIVNVIAMVQFGVGALRAARGAVADLGRWPFAISGGVALWAGGVMISQTSWLYKMLYERGSSSAFGTETANDYAQALVVAMPIVITVGIALLAVAISGFAARRGAEDLRAHAQAKGAGFVTLTLVSVAIQAWMLPKAGSLGSFAMLSLLAAGSVLVAIVMMARLLNLAADELDREPGLPTATALSDGT
ncbi:MAG TPA: hypothetical protein VIV40_10200 [Kofleriaceae bacterium]